MESQNNRRNFIKKISAAGIASLAATKEFPNNQEDKTVLQNDNWGTSPFTNNELKITGTFLDEISHDIPHQNWGRKEWDLDFKYMKDIGIDTVIMIRSGYRKFITYPSKYLISKGCYKPSTDLLDLFLQLSAKYNMKFYFGLYDSGKYWDTGDLS